MEEHDYLYEDEVSPVPAPEIDLLAMAKPSKRKQRRSKHRRSIYLRSGVNSFLAYQFLTHPSAHPRTLSNIGETGTFDQEDEWETWDYLTFEDERLDELESEWDRCSQF